tara:strand:- start:30949 stop:31860 length:912 start_codon:yes stop_codon:yes gene_type:complete
MLFVAALFRRWVSMSYRTGLLLLAAAVLMASFNGLIVRSLESADPYQIVVMRHLFMAISMFALVVYRRRTAGFRLADALNMPGIVACVSYGIGSVTFILALSYTTVAQTLLIITALPVTTAVMARIFLKESVRPSAWVAMAGSLIGILVMSGSVAEGGSLYGFLMAVVTVAVMTYFALSLRWGRDGDMTFSIAVGCLIAALMGVLVGPNQPFDISLNDLIVLMIWGGGISTLMISLFVLASRSVPGGEMMLFVAIEAALGPIWVWLAYDEVPTDATLYGGALVLASIVGFAASGMRRASVETG